MDFQENAKSAVLRLGIEGDKKQMSAKTMAPKRKKEFPLKRKRKCPHTALIRIGTDHWKCRKCGEVFDKSATCDFKDT